MTTKNDEVGEHFVIYLWLIWLLSDVMYDESYICFCSLDTISFRVDVIRHVWNYEGWPVLWAWNFANCSRFNIFHNIFFTPILYSFGANCTFFEITKNSVGFLYISRSHRIHACTQLHTQTSPLFLLLLLLVVSFTLILG